MKFGILVIAMQRETQRRLAAEKMLHQLGVDNFCFVDATDGKNGDSLASITGYEAARALEVIGRELTPSEIACYDSHRHAWEEVCRCDHPMLVLESDAVINEGTLEMCRLIVERGLGKNDLIMLNYHDCLPSVWGQQRLNHDHRLVRFANRRIYTTSSYFLFPEVAKQLLRHGQNFYLPADDYLTGGYVNKGVGAYAIFPRAAGFNELAELSTIDDERKGFRKKKRVSSLQKWTLFLRNFWRRLRRPVIWR